MPDFSENGIEFNLKIILRPDTHSQDLSALVGMGAGPQV